MPRDTGRTPMGGAGSVTGGQHNRDAHAGGLGFPLGRSPAARRAAQAGGARGPARRARGRRPARAAGRRRRAARGTPRPAMPVAEPMLRAIGGRLGARGRGDRRARQPRRRARRALAARQRRGARARPRTCRATRPRCSPSSSRGSGRRGVQRPLPGRLARRRASGRRTATTSTGTCSQRPPTGSRAACSAGCRATAPVRSTTSAPAVHRSTRVEARLTRWLPRPLAALVDDLAELLRAATMPRGQRSLLPRRWRRSPSACSAPRCGAPASRRSARVVHRLGVGRRLGRLRPRPPRGPARRRRPASTGAVRAGARGSPTAGSWVYEPLLVHHATPPHPYWPGGAIRARATGRTRGRSACSTTSPLRRFTESRGSAAAVSSGTSSCGQWPTPSSSTQSACGSQSSR